MNAVNYSCEVEEKVLWTQATSIHVLTCSKSQGSKILLIKTHLEGKKESVTPEFSNAKHNAGECSWGDGSVVENMCNSLQESKRKKGK